MNEVSGNNSISQELTNNNFYEAIQNRKVDFTHQFFERHGKKILQSQHVIRLCSISLSTLKFAIELGFDVKTEDEFNFWNVFHWAAYGGKLDVFQYLWANYPTLRNVYTGGIPSQIFQNRCSFLHTAAKGNSAEVLAFLLEQGSVDINAQTANGKTALHFTMPKNYRECTSLLIKFGADPEVKDQKQKTPLDYCEMLWGKDEDNDSIKNLKFAKKVIESARGLDEDNENKMEEVVLSSAKHFRRCVIL